MVGVLKESFITSPTGCAKCYSWRRHCFCLFLSKGEVRASPGGTNRMEQGLRPGCWSGRHLILPPHSPLLLPQDFLSATSFFYISPFSSVFFPGEVIQTVLLYIHLWLQ